MRSTGTTVIAGVLFRGRRDLHQSFGFSRAQEGVDRAEAEGIDAHAEVNPPGDQPTGRVAAIQKQQVVGLEVLEMLEQHLPLAHLGGIELEAQAEFGAGQIEGEGNGLTDFPAEGVLEEALQLGGIGGDQAQAAPARNLQVLFDQVQQMLVEEREDPMGKAMAGFREGLRADLAPQVGFGFEVGGKDIEFILDTGGEAGQQDRK